MASVTDLCSGLEGQRVRESERVTDIYIYRGRERERERRSVRHGEIMLVGYGNSVM